MKNTMLFMCIFITFVGYCQDIPYHLTPDWQSTPMGHVATGLGIADINGDGWKDIIAANGNDIARQRLVVYYNQGNGIFPFTPDWESDDIDYHGHLAVGDIDKDGWIDVAVSVYLGAGGFSTKGKVKVYYNTGGELEGIPSFQSNPFYTFSCALGDADADGDLDLAVACGEPYTQHLDQGRIFYNDGGQFNIENTWFSSVAMGPLDVEFGDMDGNGYMDVVFVSEYTPNYIYLSDQNGSINTIPSWESLESTNFMNSVDIGLTYPDEIPFFMTTGNNQLGGDGKIRQYQFDSPFPSSGFASWVSSPVGFGSGILLADVTRDERLDLIYGGWWLPVEILEGDGVAFNNDPSFTSSMTSVVEAIQMADLGKETLVSAMDEFSITHQRHVIYLEHQIVEEIIAVQKNGTLLDDSVYACVPGKNWISFAEALMPGDLVQVSYMYCLDGDLVITNWDSNKGNFIYYNTASPVAVSHQEPDEPVFLGDIYPVPATEVICVPIRTRTTRKVCLRICSVMHPVTRNSGNEFALQSPGIIEIDISGLKAGIYILDIEIDHKHTYKKFLKK